jgi:hypothetical protein
MLGPSQEVIDTLVREARGMGSKEANKSANLSQFKISF